VIDNWMFREELRRDIHNKQQSNTSAHV